MFFLSRTHKNRIHFVVDLTLIKLLILYAEARYATIPTKVHTFKGVCFSLLCVPLFSQVENTATANQNTINPFQALR